MKAKLKCFNCLITSCLISYSRRTNKWFRCSCSRRNHWLNSRIYGRRWNRSVLISSHISSDLEGLCDEIYILDKGQFIFQETTDCLLDQYGLLKLTDEQFKQIDSSYFLKTKKFSYGYDVLTNQKQFYQENYPEIIIEKNNFDTLFSMMLRGE